MYYDEKLSLYLTSRPPFQYASGGQKRAFQLLESTSKCSDVIIMTSRYDEIDKCKKEFAALSKRLIIIPHTKKEMLTGLLLSLLFCKWFTPLNVRLYFNLKVYRIIKNVGYERIICNNIRTTPYPIFKNRVYIDFVDCISDNYYNASRISSNAFLKLLYWFESLLTKMYENYVLKRCYKAFTVSTHESYLLGKGNKKITTIPVYINHKIKFDTRGKQVEEYKNFFKIGFLGKMNYEPNLMAIRWFIRNVLNELNLDTFQLLVIGGNVPKRLINKKPKGVIFLGWVENIETALNQCDALIAPMQSGSGLQTKMLDYLKHDKPIICTKKALNGFKEIPSFFNLHIIEKPEDYKVLFNYLLKLKKSQKINVSNKSLNEQISYLRHHFGKESVINLWKNHLDINEIRK